MCAWAYALANETLEMFLFVWHIFKAHCIATARCTCTSQANGKRERERDTKNERKTCEPVSVSYFRSRFSAFFCSILVFCAYFISFWIEAEFGERSRKYRIFAASVSHARTHMNRDSIFTHSIALAQRHSSSERERRKRRRRGTPIRESICNLSIYKLAI